MIHDACTFHTSFPFLKENSNGIVGGIHTYTLYTQLYSLHVSLLVYLQKIHFSPTPQQYMCRNVNPIIAIKLDTPIYIPKHISQHTPIYIPKQICIHGCTYYPQLSTFIYTCVKHVNIPVTTANTPLDRRLDGHTLTAHTYRSVEAYRSIHYHSSKWHPYNFTPYG